MNEENEEILLGSGDFYGMPFAGAIPSDETIETDANSFGHTKGGATATYKPTVYEATDDKNNVLSRIITKEEATLKCGTMSVNLKNVSKMAPSTLKDDTTKHEKVLKIGGKTSLPSYVLRFVHTKDDGTKLRFTMIGNATSGFTFQFNPDKETTLEPTFSALSQADGTLIEFRDEYTPTTPPDTIKLQSATPVDGATGVVLNVNPTITFNNALQSYNVILMDETDNSLVDTTLNIDATSKILAIEPKAALTASKTYDIILSGVTDIYGQTLAQQIIKFTTAAA